jgi:hypothetical protein
MRRRELIAILCSSPVSTLAGVGDGGTGLARRVVESAIEMIKLDFWTETKSLLIRADEVLE